MRRGRSACAPELVQNEESEFSDEALKGFDSNHNSLAAGAAPLSRDRERADAPRGNSRLLTRAAPVLCDIRAGAFAVAGLLSILAACAPPDAPGPAESAPLFDEVAADVGLRFEHDIGASGEFYLPEIMGAGAALFDYDSDGDLDAYLVQSGSFDGSGPGNQLFRNDLLPGGELRFTDVTSEAGVGDPGYGMGAAVGDYDNDGDPDLFVTNLGSNVLYRNNGDGTFSPATPRGMDDPRWSTSAAFVDYDADGDLDLFFTNYVDFNPRNNKECFDPTGARDYCTPNVYRPVPDRLFRNDGAGRWTDASTSAGLGAAYGNGLGVTCADFNGDGRIDIYVANDGVANQLWVNRGDGTFEDESLLAGAAYNADGMPEAGMGVSAADFDEDGDEDLFLTHLALETNTLYVNNGRGEFRDETNRYGLGAVSTPGTGFGMHWFDYDLDGFLDLVVANGAVTIVESQRGEPYPFRQRNQLFHREGPRFRDVTAEAGPAFEPEEVSRGAAFGDIDNDGDVDILLANNNGPARLLLNRAGDANSSLRLRLAGTTSNRDAAGARVSLPADGKPARTRRVGTDGSYLSASEPTVTFGLGADSSPRDVGVMWPNGSREIFSELAPGEVRTIEEGRGVPWPR